VLKKLRPRRRFINRQPLFDVDTFSGAETLKKIFKHCVLPLVFIRDPRFNDFLYGIWANKVLEHQVEQIGGTEWTGPSDGVIFHWAPGIEMGDSHRGDPKSCDPSEVRTSKSSDLRCRNEVLNLF
jgi:hypothetical protein